MSQANAATAIAKSAKSTYAARKGSSFTHFEYSPAEQTLSGIFKAEGKAPLTAELVSANELTAFLAKPIRLRGQALQQLIAS